MSKNDIYTKVAEEIEKGTIDKGLWAKATEMSPSDGNRIKSKYIGLRVKELKNESKQVQRKKLFYALTLVFVVVVVITAVIITIVLIEDAKSTNADMNNFATFMQERNDLTVKEIELRKESVELFPSLDKEANGLTFSELTMTDHGSKPPQKFREFFKQGTIDWIRYGQYETAGKFISVSFLVNSNDSTALGISSINYTLYDSNGRSFESFPPFSTENVLNTCSTLKPNIPCKIEVLFETAPDSVLEKIFFDYLIDSASKDVIKFGI